MGQFFGMVVDLWKSIIKLFDDRPLQIGDYQVSYFAIIFAILVISFVVSMFWKGAKS